MIVILNYTIDIEYYWRGYNRSSRIMLLILPSATTNTGNTLNNIRRYDRGVPFRREALQVLMLEGRCIIWISISIRIIYIIYKYSCYCQQGDEGSQPIYCWSAPTKS